MPPFQIINTWETKYMERKCEAYLLIEKAIKAFDDMDFNASVRILKELIEQNSEQRVLDNEEKLLALEALGIALLASERYEEGISYIEYVYNRMVAKNEADDYLSLMALHELGVAYLLMKRLDNAIALFEYEYSARMVLGEDEDAINAGYMYALSLRLDNNAIEALPIHEKNLSIIHKLQLEAIYAIDEIVELGNCYLDLCQGNKALECYELAYEYSRIGYTEYSEISQEVLLHQIKAHISLENIDKAYSICNESLAIELGSNCRRKREIRYLSAVSHIFALLSKAAQR